MKLKNPEKSENNCEKNAEKRFYAIYRQTRKLLFVSLFHIKLSII